MHHALCDDRVPRSILIARFETTVAFNSDVVCAVVHDEAAHARVRIAVAVDGPAATRLGYDFKMLNPTFVVHQ